MNNWRLQLAVLQLRDVTLVSPFVCKRHVDDLERYVATSQAICEQRRPPDVRGHLHVRNLVGVPVNMHVFDPAQQISWVRLAVGLRPLHRLSRHIELRLHVTRQDDVITRSNHDWLRWTNHLKLTWEMEDKFWNLPKRWVLWPQY